MWCDFVGVLKLQAVAKVVGSLQVSQNEKNRRKLLEEELAGQPRSANSLAAAAEAILNGYKSQAIFTSGKSMFFYYYLTIVWRWILVQHYEFIMYHNLHMGN